MGADADFLNLLNSNIRLCLSNLIEQWVALAVITVLLEKKRSLIPLALYMWGKSMVMMLLMDLRIWFGNTELFVIINGTVGVCLVIAAIYVIRFTYSGELLTTLISMVVGEIAAETVLLPSIMLTNLCEGREELLIVRASFQWVDFQILLWGGFIFAGVYVLLFPLLRKCRMREIRHRKACIALIAFYSVTSQLQGLTDFQNETLFVVSKYILTLLLSGTAMILAYLIARKYQWEIRQQREFLIQQKSRMEQHYEDIRCQIQRMEQNQKEIRGRMAEITSREVVWSKKKAKGLSAGASGIQNMKTQGDQVGAYLNELRREYDQIRTGMYCNDWMTDAVLCCQKESAEKLGIQVEYFMPDYRRGMAGGENLARMLFFLLDFGIQENEKQKEGCRKQICLHAGAVKNHLVFDFYTDCLGTARFPQKRFQEFIREWDGTITEFRKEHGLRIVIDLRQNQKFCCRQWNS